MCTPDNIPEFCSCPHLLWRDVVFTARLAAVIAVAAAVGFVAVAGYAWTLLLIPWVAAMGVAALVSSSRRQRAQMVEARATRASARTIGAHSVRAPQTATGRSPGRTRSPGVAPVPAPVPVRAPASAGEWLPALPGRPG